MEGVGKLEIQFLQVDSEERIIVAYFQTHLTAETANLSTQSPRWMGTKSFAVLPSLLASLVCVWQWSWVGLATHVMLTNGACGCPCVRLHMLFSVQGFGAAHLENPSGELNDAALISVLTARRHQRGPQSRYSRLMALGNDIEMRHTPKRMNQTYPTLMVQPVP